MNRKNIEANTDVATLENVMRTAVTQENTIQRLIKVNMMQLTLTIAVLVLLVIMVGIVVTRPIIVNNFLVDDEGRVVTEIHPSKNTGKGIPQASALMEDCIRKVMNINHTQYKQQLSAAQKGCFTPKGFQQVVDQFRESGIFDNLTANRAIASITSDQAPFVTSHGPRRQGYSWIVKNDYKWTLQQGKQLKTYNLQIEVAVVEVELNTSIRGIAINRVVIRNL